MERIKITVTDDFFDGKNGLSSILNNYYEDTIAELEEEEQARARVFIEEGLIVGERRVGMTEGVEKERYGIDEGLLQKMLDSRLIRPEHTHLGKSYELSHDSMVLPIIDSLKERQKREENLKLKAKLRQVRIRMLLLLVGSLFVFLMSVAMYFLYQKAQTAERELQNSFEELTEVSFSREEVRYEQLLTKGKLQLKNEDYSAAITSFTEAIKLSEEYEDELNRLDIEKKLDDSGARAKTQLAAAKSTAEQNEVFQNLLNEAAQLAQSTNVQKKKRAIEQYEKAKIYDLRIDFIELKIRELNQKLDRLFEEAKTKGDRSFAAGGNGYKEALRHYQKAQEIKPEDTYISKQIDKCNLRLNR